MVETFNCTLFVRCNFVWWIYFLAMSPQALTQEIITKSFLLSRDFLLIELELETNETLGEECWLKLLKVSEVYLAEEKEYEESRSALDWR